MTNSTDSESGNRCVFCGAEAEVSDVVVRFSGQEGHVECSGCGRSYDLVLRNVEETDDD